jgi:hypothetical protein
VHETRILTQCSALLALLMPRSVSGLEILACRFRYNLQFKLSDRNAVQLSEPKTKQTNNTSEVGDPQQGHHGRGM